MDKQVEPLPFRQPIMFYDGECGLCHGAVKFVLKHDRSGQICFAPMQGQTAVDVLSEETYARLGRTMAVLMPDGEVLLEDDGVLMAMKLMGGIWGMMAGVFRIVPRFIRRPLYRFVAMIRRKLTRKPEGACPMVAPELRKRFLP